MSDILEAGASRSFGRSPAGSEHDRAHRRSWRKRSPTRRPELTPDRTIRSDCQCRHPFGEIIADGGEVLLDVRSLPWEGQFGRTLQRMEVLPTGNKLRLITSLVPWPLFAMLETRGYRYRLVGRDPGNVQILIWPLKFEPSVEAAKTRPG